METFGSLCDKLIVIKLKQYHTKDAEKLASLNKQDKMMQWELNDYVIRATTGNMLVETMACPANKVYSKTVSLPNFTGELGELISSLSYINCEIWHDVDKSYHPDVLPHKVLAELVHRLAVLNLQRNKCIEAIDLQFKGQVML